MLHDLICPDCGMVSEHLLGQDDRWVEVKCPGCGKPLTRGAHKKYAGMRYYIQGDTVPGGCNYDYYDPGLDCQITNKQHRQAEMDRQGVTEFEPDKTLQKHRQEALKILKSAPKGNAEAHAAAGAELDAAKNKRSQRAIDRVWDKAGLSSDLE